MEDLVQDEVVKYLKHFDKIFNTKLEENFNIDELILFFTGFKKVADEIKPTNEYLDIQEKKCQILDEINLNNEQQKYFNKYCELEHKTNEEYKKEILILMYIFMRCFWILTDEIRLKFGTFW